MSKGYSYSGTHWTQRPENKEKVRKMAMKRAKMKKLARSIVRQTKKYKPRVKKENNELTSIVFNGYRISISNGEIRVEKE